MSELPTGTVTFLFTDLEGSTRRWEEHPEAMKAALARHDEILRDAIETNKGHVVKTTGDGVHAAFGTAPDALATAVQAQRAMSAEPWALPDPLRIRIGLHTGSAELRAGDYYGPALNRAARLMAAGHGGQILLSNAAEELVRDSLPEGVTLLDLGNHSLRDLARPDRVFQVCVPALETRFPALRSLDSFPGNLPVQLTTFVARETELKQLSDALHASRLVTLTGVGGVGKTRLAIQLAADLVPEFDDGAWICELAGASDPESMIQLVAATLGAQMRAGCTLEESVVDFLRTKRLLLVLDNCEHLLDATGRFAEGVLASCPNGRIIATSREGLAVPGEQVWPVRSLPVPDAEATVDEIASREAVQLFADRARAARPTFAIDEGNAPAVAEICRRLDGIPLAIELAAARLAAMSPPEIARRLDERFRLLTGGRRTAVERHQTLRATVDWSYSLLDERDRIVFDRLGVFVGGFDTEAAEAVAAGDGFEPWDVVDAVGDLVTKSLVIADEAVDGTTRYEMLETLRHYALEQLEVRRDTDERRRHHAEHFVAVAEEMGPSLRGPDELAWRGRLRAELDNLRSAVTWALDRAEAGDRELGVRIIAALAMQVSFDPSLGIGAWAERAVEAAEATQPGRRHAVLGAVGYHRATAGRFDEATDAAQSALRDGVPADSPWPGLATNVLSFVDIHRGSWDDAIERLEAFLTSPAASLLDPPEQVTFHSMIGGMRSGTGDLEAAAEHTGRALEIARRIGTPSALCSALYSNAVAIRFSDPDRCIAQLEQSIELTRAGATPVVFGYANAALAVMKAERGEREAALRALRDALTYAAEIGDHPQLLNVCAAAVQAFSPLGIFEPVAPLSGYAMAAVPAVRAGPDSGFSGVEAFVAAVARARDGLGAEVFDAAVERGTTMSYDEIVQNLRDALDALLAESP
jgi:predicted ATPase/class 3 adenylate cyclase